MRRSLKEASSHSARARWSSGSDSGWPWKLPPATTSPSSGKTSGLSVTACSSRSSARLDVGERVVDRAEHLRRAAQRVGVLHAAAVGVAGDDLAARPAARAAARRPAARPGCGRTPARRSSNGTVEPLNASSDSASATTAASSSRRASRTASPPAAAIRCVPLMSASPSLGSSATGSRPARRSAAAPSQALAVELRLALADQHEREVGERREVARGPDRALGSAPPGRRRARASPAAARRPPRARRSARAAATRPAAAASRARPRRAAAGPAPTACERTRLSCSCAASSAPMRTLARFPKPVVTP